MFNRGGFHGQRPMGHHMMNQSGMNHPGMNNPGMSNQGMNNPGMNNQGMNNPGMNNQGMNNPGMNNQGMNNPGMGNQGMNNPGMGNQGMNNPGMGNQGMNNPGMGNQGMNNPGMGNQGMNKPGMGNQGMNNPGMGNQGMNNPGMGNQGMNMSGMNMPGMNMGGMNMPAMNQQNMNHPGMNNQGMNHSGMNSGMNHPRMGHPGMNRPNMGFSGMNQQAMGLNRMNHPGVNQGGMGYHSEMKGQGFGMRPGDSTGSFGGGNPEPVGMKQMPVRSPMISPAERHMGPQTMQQRFPGPNVPPRPGQPRMPNQSQEIPSIVNRVVAHSSDHLMGKPKAPGQEPAHLMKDKQWEALNVFGNMGREMGMKSQASTLDQMSNPQNRYTNESASSILESFGLSNEDLEELSRYPDDQLTPGNMPSILRDIRLRKVSRSGAPPDPGAGRRQGNDMMPSKVIDYGHASKFQYNDRSASERSYEPSRPTESTPPKANKEPAESQKKPEKLPENSMDNKIPTISGSRKPMWPQIKGGRSNNKTLVGEQNPVAPSEVHVPINVQQMESPNVTIQTDATLHPEVPANVRTDRKPELSGANVGYQVPAETAAAEKKGNWIPVLPTEETQKLKRLPTPSMMNDYYAASPRIFPHICSLCNVECKHLKDWIRHQNYTSHIENCRKLSQQYPDWNPQVHSSIRNEDKKDDPSSNRSKSKSGSPRRSRRSTSRRRSRKSQSRSPRSSVRTRSRSPRPPLRARSRSPRRPRHSPRRSRSPRRVTRSPRHSMSPRRPRPRHRTSSNSPDKRAVDAAVQSFIQATKLKSGEKAKPSNSKKAPLKSTNKRPTSGSSPALKSGSSVKTPGSSASSATSSSKRSDGNTGSVKKPSAGSNPVKKTGTVAPRRTLSSSPGSKRPAPSASTSKKPIVSTAAKKTTSATTASKKPAPGKQPLANRRPSNLQKSTPGSPANEPYNTLNKFTNKNNSGKIIHITNLPDSGYTDQDLLKIIQPFGKVCDILIVRSKNEAFLETNFKEAATAAVNFSNTNPVMINNQRVHLCLAGQTKKAPKIESKSVRPAEPSNKTPIKTGKKDADKVSRAQTTKVQEVPPGFVKCFRLSDPQLMESEKCVIQLCNLPESQYTVEEICNLAKPFGGVNDVLILSNYRKAYLELSSHSSAESMIKFYSTFSTHLGGKLLSVTIDPRFKDLKDVDRIFATLIEESSYQILPSIYERFVYLEDIPEKDVSEYDVILIGLRFGKVEHCVILSNKRKAILHMQCAGATKTMYQFLTKYPCSIGNNRVRCALPAKTRLAEDEYESFLEEVKVSSYGRRSNDEEKVTREEHKESSLPTSPISQTEMEVDAAEVKQDAEEEAAAMESSSPGVAAYASDDDDEEEAAEAAEAPDTEPITYYPPEPVVEPEEPAPPAYPPLLPEELEVLVSVESDEEECEEPRPSFVSPSPVAAISNACQPSVSVSEETEEDTDKEPPVYITTDERPVSPDSTSANETPATPEPHPEPQSEVTTCVKAESGDAKEPEDAGGSEQAAFKPEERSTEAPVKEEAGESPPPKMEDGAVTESKPEPRSQSPKATAPEKAADETAKDAQPATPTSGATVTRTAKYNPQKGEISVTLSLDSQKAAAKTADSRKRSSRERGSTGRESSTPKSNSNRSSPTDSASSNPRTSAGGSASQKKNGSKHISPQSTFWTRERDSRGNVRKDERAKGNSSSSRYTRSNRTRDTRCREEEDEEPFPFNLDEFVTVDEIVEDHTDSKASEEPPRPVAATPRRGKRKDGDPLQSGGKKPKEARVDPSELSFVTLDEVGDEEDGTVLPETTAGASAQPMVTVDEVRVEDAASHGAKDSQTLMTLDEVSDEEDVQDSTLGVQTSAMPEILAKDQLLTLDEVSGEDEEQTPPSEPPKAETPGAKMEESGANPIEQKSPAPEEAPRTDPSQGDVTQSQLLTLDEVKADDDDEFLADIECRFLTVDEVGGEEEDTEAKDKEADEPTATPPITPLVPETKTSPKHPEPSVTPATKRGRPRKRPLPAEESKSQPPSDSNKTAEPEKTPAKPEKTPAKPKGKPRVAGVEESPLPTPETPDSGDKKSKGSGSPVKKKKLTAPSTEKKLAPFNPTVPIGIEFLIPKTGYFCELCSLFYMDEASKLKHCKSMRHYQAVEKHLSKGQESSDGKS